MNISTEYRKGVMFVRLKGILNKNNVKELNEKVTKLVNTVGIRNLVFNFNDLKDIDSKGINALLYNYEIIKRNGGNMFLCTSKYDLIDKLKRFHILKYMGIINDELKAIELMKG